VTVVLLGKVELPLDQFAIAVVAIITIVSPAFVETPKVIEVDEAPA
jgi:hypothetical protein